LYRRLSRPLRRPPLSRSQLEKYAALKAEKLRRESVSRGVLGSLFPEQLRAAQDTSKKKLYCTTRRAGKTTGFLSECLHTGQQEPGSRFAYVALTRPSAEDIAWPILHELDLRHGLGLAFQQAKLQATLPNGSQIKLYGADRPGWIYRLYGQKLRRVGIDEAAFFSININELISDILEPSVADLEGEIILMSIPGLTPAGFYYEAFSGVVPGWSVHQWSALDNPYMDRQFRQKMDALIAADPNVITTPSYRRNYLGEWVYDASELVYTYNHELCSIPVWEPPRGVQYVLGLDMGWHDATAFSLCAWSEDSPEFVEIESRKRNKMLISEVAETIHGYMERYPELRIVGDASKRQVFEELRQRYDVPIYAAEKQDKFHWIDLVNADFAAGRIKILVEGKTTPHILEMEALGIKTLPSGKKVEQPGRANDCCDSFVYAYRDSYHFRYRQPEPVVQYGTPEYWAQYEDKVVDHLEDVFGNDDDDPWS